MNITPIISVTRCTVAIVGLAFALNITGCGGGDDSHDETDHSHSTATEQDDHADDDSGGNSDAASDTHGDHAHDIVYVEPKTFADAVHTIQHSMSAVEDALNEDRLADIHADAEVISKVARLTGELALATDSGVTREAVRDVNVAGRELANASDALHEASDEGDHAKSQTEFDRMKTQVEILVQHAGTAGGDDHGGDADHHDDSDHNH